MQLRNLIYSIFFVFIAFSSCERKNNEGENVSVLDDEVVDRLVDERKGRSTISDSGMTVYSEEFVERKILEFEVGITTKNYVKEELGIPSVEGIFSYSYFYWDPFDLRNATKSGKKGMILYFDKGLLTEIAENYVTK